MSFRTRAAGVLRWFRGDAKGTLYPLDTNAEESALPVGSDGKVLTADSTAAGGMSWQDLIGELRAAVSALRGVLASKAPLFSPQFFGSPRVPTAAPGTNSEVAASTAYADAAVAAGGGGAGSVDPSAISALQGAVAGKAPLLSPQFLGTPRANGLALATQAYADALAAAAAAGPSDLSALRGLLAAAAPLLSPRFLGTPTKNGVPLATTADIPAAADPASDQFILASQIFGA